MCTQTLLTAETTICTVLLFCCLLSASAAAGRVLVDRPRVVSRHNPLLQALRGDDPHLAPSFLTVGNGEFAFTTDFTGLQSFNQTDDAVGGTCGNLPNILCPRYTLSYWGWHETPPQKYRIDPSSYRYANLTFYNHTSPYAFSFPPHGETSYFSGNCNSGACEDATAWLRGNPHKINLARISLKLGGLPLPPSHCTNITQQLDLFSGILTSSFFINNNHVKVITAVHGKQDVLAFQIYSQLINSGDLKVEISFPYAADFRTQNVYAADWTRPHDHKTYMKSCSSPTASEMSCHDFHREVDRQSYSVRVGVENDRDKSSNSDCTISPGEVAHQYVVSPLSCENHTVGTSLLTSVVFFSPTSITAKLPTFDEVVISSTQSWKEFWLSGAALDLSASSDPRASLLERKVVLSQYILRVQEAGSLPPAETGLTLNSWWGDFHAEMRMWHQAHWWVWGRSNLLHRSDAIYDDTLDEGIDQANFQGYKGVRWWKERSLFVPSYFPSMYMKPSSVGAVLLDHQVHPIIFAEMAWRDNPSQKTLLRFNRWVNATSEFMLSFLARATGSPEAIELGCVPLGPPMLCGMVEGADPRPHQAPNCNSSVGCFARTRNPTYELVTWRWGLEIARLWRSRLGLSANPALDEAINTICRPKIRRWVDPVSHEEVSVYFDEEFSTDLGALHAPAAMLYATGFFPGFSYGINMKVMNDTLWKLWSHFRTDVSYIPSDLPPLAMSAARMGQPKFAIDILSSDAPSVNFNPVNGQNQPTGRGYGSDMRLPLFTPANGAFLLAIGMMAGGWDGSLLSGFPHEWHVKAEGFSRVF